MEEISILVDQLEQEDPSKAFRAQSRLRQIVHSTTQPEAIASVLAVELTSKVRLPAEGDSPEREDWKHSAAVRRLLCSFLSLVGSEAETTALREMLGDLETREAARGALALIPGTRAIDALVEALDQFDSSFRIGIIHTLGQKGGKRAKAILSELAADSQPEIRLAALEALASFPVSSIDQFLLAGLRTGSRRDRSRIRKARVRLADTLRQAGDQKGAIAIYRSIDQSDEEDPQREAARRALQELE